MKNFIRIAGIVLAVLVLLLLVGPLAIPIPALSGVVPVHQLADDDSQFTAVDGIDFHYKTMGTGTPSLVLLHGFGASLYSWREVLPDLAENYRVYTYDRLAFGLTERPTEWEGENPYSRSAAVDHLESLLTAWDAGEAILVGNSAGGTVAIEYALRRPENVQALILVSPGISGGGNPYSRYQWLLNTPQMQRIGPLLVRSIQKSGLAIIDQAWHDPSRQPEDTVPLYTKPLQAENWDFALWQYSTAGEGTNLSGRLGELNLPVLVITGDDDRIIPTRQTIENAGEIPGAELVVLPSCGHVPQEECPGAFLDAVEAFLDVTNN
ncbi:MAG: alpha/beta hydrolase [Anaerolineales bacterium]|jgi:pimeloyl-ACP methyl ester carboxylesterase